MTARLATLLVGLIASLPLSASLDAPTEAVPTAPSPTRPVLTVPPSPPTQVFSGKRPFAPPPSKAASGTAPPDPPASPPPGAPGPVAEEPEAGTPSPVAEEPEAAGEGPEVGAEAEAEEEGSKTPDFDNLPVYPRDNVVH